MYIAKHGKRRNGTVRGNRTKRNSILFGCSVQRYEFVFVTKRPRFATGKFVARIAESLKRYCLCFIIDFRAFKSEMYSRIQLVKTFTGYVTLVYSSISFRRSAKSFRGARKKIILITIRHARARPSRGGSRRFLLLFFAYCPPPGCMVVPTGHVYSRTRR